MKQKFRIYFLFLFAVIFIPAIFGFKVRIEEEFDESNVKLTCVPCNPGSYSGSFSVDGMILNCSRYCNLGFCPIGVNCTLCPTGTFNDKLNASSCLSCGVGKVSQRGSLNCTSCQPGSTTNLNASSCVLCSAGSFSNNPDNPCQPCSPGYYSAQPGSTVCSGCQSGSYNPLFGQTVCFPCGKGKYNPSSYSTSITACLVCPGGYYCPELRTATPVPCPSDNFCPAGASEPSSCPLLFKSDESSENCQPKATLYLLLLGGVAALVVIVATVVCIRAGKSKSGPESKSKQPTETDRLIPQPRDGPVYEGL